MVDVCNCENGAYIQMRKTISLWNYHDYLFENTEGCCFYVLIVSVLSMYAFIEFEINNVILLHSGVKEI